MEAFLKQIRMGLKSNLYFLSLFGALALPDICGAMSSKSGLARKKEYTDWFQKYVGQKYRIRDCQSFSGADCYFFRCSILHQGSTEHKNSKFSKILFIEPGSSTHLLHNNIMKDVLNIDVSIFCNDILNGVEEWLKEVQDTELFKKNYKKVIRRYPNGLPPLTGYTVIG